MTPKPDEILSVAQVNAIHGNGPWLATQLQAVGRLATSHEALRAQLAAAEARAEKAEADQAEKRIFAQNRMDEMRAAEARITALERQQEDLCEQLRLASNARIDAERALAEERKGRELVQGALGASIDNYNAVHARAERAEAEADDIHAKRVKLADEYRDLRARLSRAVEALRVALRSHENLYLAHFGDDSNPGADIARRQMLAVLAEHDNESNGAPRELGKPPAATETIMGVVALDGRERPEPTALTSRTAQGSPGSSPGVAPPVEPPPPAATPQRCPACGWPLAVSEAEGCVPGNCSWRGGDKMPLPAAPLTGPTYAELVAALRDLVRGLDSGDTMIGAFARARTLLGDVDKKEGR